MNNLYRVHSHLGTMKRLAICAILVFACVNAYAQSDFDKLAKIKGVEYTHIGKDMIKLAALAGEGLHVGDMELNLGVGEGEDFLNQFDDVKVFTCEQKGSIQKFKKTALKLLKGQEWEPLIDTKGDDGEIVKIYLSKNGEHSTNVILSVEDEEANLVVIDGTFDLAKMMQEGMRVKAETDNFEVETNNTSGQTAEELMEKYKAFPGAEYKEKTEEALKDIIEEGPGEMSQEDFDFIVKNFKKSEQVQLTLDEAQKEELEKELKALKGYELLLTQNDNTEPEEGNNVFQNMLNQAFSPSYQIRVYAKMKGNIITGTLLRLDMWGKVVLSYTVGKWKKDDFLKSLYNGDAVSFSEDEDENGVTDMKDVVKEAKDGNALFVIGGEEHPELRSLDEAKEYMEKNNFHFNHETWVVGKRVKEKYPNTDRKVVIEYTDEPNK